MQELPEQRVEIVLVDDASEDQSMAMCQAFAMRRKNVKVLARKQNGGVGACVNDGLALCVGEWIQRCDSDDEIDAHGLLSALDCAEQNSFDVVMQSFCRIAPDNKIVREDLKPIAENESPLAYYWRTGKPGSWVIMVRRSIVVENAILVNTKISNGEDRIWVLDVMSHVSVERLGFSNAVSYRYHSRSGSLSQQEASEKARRALVALDAMMQSGENFVLKGYLSRDFMNYHLSNGVAATVVKRLVKAKQYGEALCEYHRLRYSLGSSPRLRKQFYRCVVLRAFRLFIPQLR